MINTVDPTVVCPNCIAIQHFTVLCYNIISKQGKSTRTFFIRRVVFFFFSFFFYFCELIFDGHLILKNTMVLQADNFFFIVK